MRTTCLDRFGPDGLHDYFHRLEKGKGVMRISDVFTMGAGYENGGRGNGDEYFSENPCYQGSGCVRDKDFYTDSRLQQRGLRAIIGSRRNGGSGLSALFINHS
jgi:hypothetical protein